MKSRRDRIDVIYDILSAIEKEGGQIKPTRLMYKSNLSHKLLKSHMQDLIERGVIEETTIKKKNYIVITESGKKFISELRKMRRFLESFGL
ncbi:MAG: winged helix-turn-helix transcriptional regulator [Candidatus Aenigmarchaeota archaeon]|nr:winged helix-turn-helix transcriptional regulator [Candidatus Aenigmarchaeota archaeon]